MRLRLKNIGIIKEADIKLDGLTVIAGENDSGKSTVGKVLYALVKSIKFASSLSGREDKYVYYFNKYIKKLFKEQISKDGNIDFTYKEDSFFVDIKNSTCKEFQHPDGYKNIEAKMTSPLLIDTPYIWNLFPTLNTIKNIETSDGIDFEILETLKDLYAALNIKQKDGDDKIKIDIQSIIKGKFKEESLGGFVFEKENKRIELVNTAMGIKYFGILQVLSDKNHFHQNQFLILDEPEVHLHPKWQLKLAKVIVYLVEKGVKILVNSHSPYMIEAMQRYAKQSHISTNFYIAENNKIVEDTDSLSKIFAKLSEPFDEFDKMDSESLNG